MSKKEFWIRMPLFILFSLIAPIIYVSVRYEIFKESTSRIGFIEILLIGFISIILLILVKYYVDGLKTRYTLFKQVLRGFMKIILPLFIFLMVLVIVKEHQDKIIQFLYVLIPSEFIAIIVNPMPKWCFNNNVEGLGEIFKKIRGDK